MAATSATCFYDVDQRTPEWHSLRRCIGGSTVGQEIGLSSYQGPGAKRVFDERGTAAVKHGQLYEPVSADKFVDWVKSKDIESQFSDIVLITRWRDQTYNINPGYDVPLVPHPFFPHADDYQLFGVSLDMRGSVIDVEIKNPVTYRSLYSNYLEIINPIYFAQVQWAMAIRQRKQMFFVATSFDQETGAHLGTVVWHVLFAEKFFREFIYPRARAAALAIRDGNPNPVSWVNKGGAFTKSDTYKNLMSEFCRRVFVWKNGRAIAAIISKTHKK